MKGYPRWFLRALITSFIFLWFTGALLTPTTLVLRMDMTLPWRLSSGGRIGFAALHALGGFVLLMFMGALWTVHMRAGWRRRRQRVSGALLVTVLITLAVSAVVIYYAGDESAGLTAALLHTLLGLFIIIPFGWHWQRGVRARANHHQHQHQHHRQR